MVLNCDDAFADTNHIGGHADTAVLVRDQRLQKVVRNGQVFGRGKFRLPGEKKLVFADVANHK